MGVKEKEIDTDRDRERQKEIARDEEKKDWDR